ncbi:MAG: restriction endonuclease subunit S [Gammaproteobacteria bacterium]
MSWPIVALSDICDIDIGKTPARGKPEYWSPGVEEPWITISDLNQGRTVRFSKEQVSEAGILASRMKKVPAGTLLLSFKLSIGKVGIAERPLYTNEAIAALNDLSVDADRDYLYWALKRIDLLAYTDRAAKGKTLNKAKLKQIQIPLPPLPEQRRIAAILDKADALRQKRREAIAKLDQLFQSVFLEMFGDPITNPKGWEFAPLAELLSRKPINGAYYPKEKYTDAGGIPMVHMSDAFYGVVRKESLKRVLASPSDQKKYALTCDDLLISRRSLKYEGAAQPCLIEEMDEALIFESSLIRITPDPAKMLPIYLHHYFANPRAKSKYVLMHVTKSTISGINQSNLNKVEVMKPPICIQHSFQAVVDQVRNAGVQADAGLRTSDQLFSSLQQRAFNGQL